MTYPTPDTIWAPIPDPICANCNADLSDDDIRNADHEDFGNGLTKYYCCP